MGAEQSANSSTPQGPLNGPNVLVNVYQQAQQTMQVPGFGVYHTGVQIGYTEYTFAGLFVNS